MKKVSMFGKILTAMLTVCMAVMMGTGPVMAAGNIVDQKDKKYSYGNMKSDLQKFVKMYPDKVKLTSLGKTADKRELYCLVMGNPDAKKQIIVQSSMHAREYMNSQMIMASVERYLKKYETGSYKGVSYKKLFENVAVYVIPMENPDGITISQYGPGAIRNKKLRKKIRKMKRYGSYRRWKANARGVDLNRNFSKGWGRGSHPKRKASANYPGKKSFTEAETKALARLVKKLPNLKACLSYHSTGSMIYWNYGQKGKFRTRTKKLANTIKSMNGYRLLKGNTFRDGGFGEWCVCTQKIPNLTIETGRGAAPIARGEYSGIYRKNLQAIERTAYLYR